MSLLNPFSCLLFSKKLPALPVLAGLLLSAPLFGFAPNGAAAQDRWFGFDVLSGDPASSRHLALLVREQGSSAPGAPPDLYDAVLLFQVGVDRQDPRSEIRRLSASLAPLAQIKAEVHLWAEGLAGLIARGALSDSAELPNLKALVLVDVPHRGRSPSGWPEWKPGDVAATRTPQWAVSGSRFLVELNNATSDSGSVPVFNIWRRNPSPVPRAAVMQLPRASVSMVVDAAADHLWAVMNAQAAAITRTPKGGPRPREMISGPVNNEDEAKRYAARQTKDSAPSLAALLQAEFTLPAGANEHWVEYGSKRVQPSDPLSRMTDVIGARWVRGKGVLMVFGYEDYFREPLRLDVLTAAVQAYRQQQPAISIDPRRLGDPPGQAPVRYDGGIANTRLGGLLFEPDRVMKALSLGRDNLTNTVMSSAVPGHAPIVSEHPEAYSSQPAVWRLWFEPERWHGRVPDPSTVLLDARFKVNWQKMTAEYAPSGAVVHFTDQLTHRFSEYAQEIPALDQLDQSAELIALGSWIVDAKLDLSTGALPKLQFATPAYTPLIQVSSTGTFDRYQVTQIVEGGTVPGPQLRYVRIAPSDYNAIVTSALADLYPPLRGPPVSTTSAPPRKAPALPPAAMPRPPPYTASMVTDDFLMQAAFIPALAKQAVAGITRTEDKLSDPPKSVDDIIRARALAPQVDTVSVDDAEETALLIFKGSQFGDKPGEVELDGVPLKVFAWEDRMVLVHAPVPLTGGTIRLRSDRGESNPIQLTVVPGVARREPPVLKVVNRAEFIIRVLIDAEVFGSIRAFDLAPGESRTTKLMAGRYRVIGSPIGEAVVAGNQNDWREFQAQTAYTLTYEARSFPTSKIVIHNTTGRAVTFSLSGKISRVIHVAPGDMTIQIAPGQYSVSASAWCGSSSRELTIRPGTVDSLTYGCH